MLTTAIGKRGEDLASQWLLNHGYKIVDRNWKNRWCEIDIIASRADIVYFVEVKFRQTDTYGSGFDYITAKKYRQMEFAAEFWMKHSGYTGACQLAAASVSGNTGEVEFIDDL